MISLIHHDNCTKIVPVMHWLGCSWVFLLSYLSSGIFTTWKVIQSRNRALMDYYLGFIPAGGIMNNNNDLQCCSMIDSTYLMMNWPNIFPVSKSYDNDSARTDADNGGFCDDLTGIYPECPLNAGIDKLPRCPHQITLFSVTKSLKKYPGWRINLSRTIDHWFYCGKYLL